ncbi:MAG TPA: hypothetical protein PLB59_01635 [Bacteroidales bacterium]|nr:hypothetical protein [Bacteroidales bacterium]HQP14643.1 hypothetical protein [Bacteroidales bacterium]
MKLTLAEHIAQSRIIVAANKAKGNRHAEMFATMYAQPARFIEEILQNTEDAYARKKTKNFNNLVRFKLFGDRVEIHHNGKDFDEADLMSITTFAHTTKTNDSSINQIGKFGIGFKSVFSITDTPEIHCEPYHYAITDYEVLENTEPKKPDENFNTLIILPFKKKSQAICFDAVKNGLTELNEYSLLFLKKTSCIEIYFSGANALRIERRQTITDKIFRLVSICKTYAQGNQETTDYIIFSQEPLAEKQQPELAFKTEKNQEKITFTPIDNAPVCVYFPTRMNSRLHFILNAPFTTNPLREYIPFDSRLAPQNLRVLDESKKLFLKVLRSLKQKKWFDLRLIAMLPLMTTDNHEPGPTTDSLIYRTFYDTLLSFLRSEAAIPLPGNRYAAIHDVMMPHNGEIAALLDPKDLHVLFQKKYFVDPQINANQFGEVKKYFEEGLQVKTADAQGFGFRLRVAVDFLKEKKIPWLKKFYQYVHKQQFLWDEFHVSEYYSLRSAAIVLTQSGSFVAAYTDGNRHGVFLPVGTKCLLPVIHKKLAGDTDCLAFFKDMGISEPEMADDVEFNIIPQFGDAQTIFGKHYVKSIEKIIQAYISVPLQRKERIAGLLKNTPWLCCVPFGMPAAYAFKKPEDIYIHSAGLMNYFEGYYEAWVVEPSLFKHLSKKYGNAFAALLEDTGIRKFPLVSISESKLIEIDGLESFLKNMTVKKSQAFAGMLLSCPAGFLPKYFFDFLKNKNWIYTNKNIVESAANITASDLASLYKFSDDDKSRLCLLLGIEDTKAGSLQRISLWHPAIPPEKAANADQHAAPISVQAGKMNAEQHAVFSVTFPNGLQDDECIYSGEVLEKIQRWSCSYVKNILQKSARNNNKVVNDSGTADLSVHCDDGSTKHIFVCGKTDLLNSFPLTAGQLSGMLQLSSSAGNTCLYLVNSAGTERVTFSIIINPLNLLTLGNLGLNGIVWITGDYQQ